VNKSEYLRVRLDPERMTQVKHLAEASDCTVSDLVRHLIERALPRIDWDGSLTEGHHTLYQASLGTGDVAVGFHGVASCSCGRWASPDVNPFQTRVLWEAHVNDEKAVDRWPRTI
jgi:hypothetical protein